MQFLMRTVERLLPGNHQPSTQSNPSPQAPASSTINLPYNGQQQQYQPQQFQPQQHEEESNNWAGNPDLTQFLEENGVGSIQDLLQYTAGQEQTAGQMQEIFEYAMHPDPEVRSQFWSHYQEALAEQGVIETQERSAPSLPGTPDNYSYRSQTVQGFGDVGQFAQQFALMNSGLPGITPQSLAEFDRAILMTPGAFWAQNVFDFGDI
ncbi:MAG: hypothetical protein ACR2LR_09710 [Hassallia sp.]